MLPNLDKLALKCQELGLAVTQKGKRPAKDDYVQALRRHYMPEGGLAFTELTPMLCFAEWNLKPEEQKKVWESPNWIAQQKLNGCRAVLHFVEGVGVFAHSRTISLKTYRYQELTKQLLFHDFVPGFTATIDCELIIEKPVDTRPYSAKGEVTKTSLHSTTAALHLEPENARKLQIEQDAPLMVQAFDMTNINGRDIKSQPLLNRLQSLKDFQVMIAGTEIGRYFQFPSYTTSEKRAFFEKIVKEGGEGVILKNLRASYEDSSSRPRDGWIKVKKRIEFDAFVTGFIRGEKGTGWEKMVGALEFSVKTEKGIHVLGFGSNLTMETRQKITQYDPETDTVTLNPAILGKVAEISGQDVSARSFRLSHCTIDRWRPKNGPDAKRAEDCIVKMADLEAAAEWVA